MTRRDVLTIWRASRGATWRHVWRFIRALCSRSATTLDQPASPLPDAKGQEPT